MTNTDLKARIRTYTFRAQSSQAIADYLQAELDGATPEALQELWHKGFELYGPRFAAHIALPKD